MTIHTYDCKIHGNQVITKTKLVNTKEPRNHPNCGNGLIDDKHKLKNEHDVVNEVTNIADQASLYANAKRR